MNDEFILRYYYKFYNILMYTDVWHAVKCRINHYSLGMCLSYWLVSTGTAIWEAQKYNINKMYVYIFFRIVLTSEQRSFLILNRINNYFYPTVLQ